MSTAVIETVQPAKEGGPSTSRADADKQSNKRRRDPSKEKESPDSSNGKTPDGEPPEKRRKEDDDKGDKPKQPPPPHKSDDPNHNEPPPRRPAPTGEFLKSMSVSVRPLIAIHRRRFIVVDTANYVRYFTHTYNVLVNAAYPHHASRPPGMITQANFILVARYIMKARIDLVFSKNAAARLTGRIPPFTDFMLPKSLADVINSIGEFTFFNGYQVIVPEPEAPPGDANQALSVLVTRNILTQFNTLINDLVQLGISRPATMSTAQTGTAYWLLTARTLADTANIANGNDTVIVSGVFENWTPADMMMAAIVQNQFTGLIPPALVLKFYSEPINNISKERTRFILEA